MAAEQPLADKTPEAVPPKHQLSGSQLPFPSALPWNNPDAPAYRSSVRRDAIDQLWAQICFLSPNAERMESVIVLIPTWDDLLCRITHHFSKLIRRQTRTLAASLTEGGGGRHLQLFTAVYFLQERAPEGKGCLMTGFGVIYHRQARLSRATALMYTVLRFIASMTTDCTSTRSKVSASSIAAMVCRLQ